MTAAGAGAFGSLRAAAAAMSRVTGCAEPGPASQAAYEAGFRAYQHIAAALADSG